MIDTSLTKILRLSWLALLLALAAPSYGAVTEGSFVIFDGMGGYKSGKPDLTTQYGLKRIRIIYASELWGPREPLVPTAEDKTRIQALLRKLDKDMPGGYVMLDVEHWRTRAAYVKEPIDENIQKLINLADWVHEAAPSLKVGYFGVIPVDDYYLLRRPQGLEAFAADNNRITPLAKHVDVLFPCIYSITDNVQEWETWARMVLEAARQFKKPVYPVLWPEYHPSLEPLAGQFIPGAFWTRMLELSRVYADGAVIWSSDPTVGSGGAPWNDDWQWWQATKTFMRQYGSR